MSQQTWAEMLVDDGGAAGASFSSFTTAKTVLPAGALYAFAPGFFKIGKKLRVKVQGSLSNIVTTPGTITFQIMLGSVVVWTSGAIQLNATAHTLLPFELEVLLTARAFGATAAGNLIGIGRLNGVMFTRTAAQVDQVNIGDSLLVPITAPTAGTGFDSTAVQTLDFWAGFSISNAANTIRVEQYAVESLN